MVKWDDNNCENNLFIFNFVGCNLFIAKSKVVIYHGFVK